MEEMTEKLEYMVEKCPEKVVEMAKQMYRRDPEMVEKMLQAFRNHGGHISSRKKYEELVEKLKWANENGRGAKWNFEDIKKNAKINFENTDFTEYDYAYLVNMLYAKCCKYVTDPSIYLKFAKCLLEDNDEETKLYRGAYQHKQKYNMRGERDYHENPDMYGEENRHRHYRSERTYDPFYEDENMRRRYRSMNDEMNNYNNYDDYENSRRYYKESNIGFSI